MISVDLTLKERDRIHLQKILLKLKNNPYSNYESFEKDVDGIIKSGDVPDELVTLTVESIEIVNCLTYGGIETAQFPLSIYRPWFRSFFTFVVPLVAINWLCPNLPVHAHR